MLGACTCERCERLLARGVQLRFGPVGIDRVARADQVRHSLDPRGNRWTGLDIETAFLSAVTVCVDRDIGNGQALLDQKSGRFQSPL